MRKLIIRIDLDAIARAARQCRHVLWSGLKQAAKVSRFILIMGVMTGWIFSGWPEFGHNPFFPPVRDAEAAAEVIYKSSTIAFSPRTITGGATDAFDPAGAFDNAFSSEISLPFTFDFYGTDYDSIWISTNGFISFTGDDPGGAARATITPNTAVPNAYIAPGWADLYFDTAISSRIRYETFGSAPHRVFVVDFLNLSATSDIATVRFISQVQMYEGTNVVEFHTTDITLTETDASYVQGVENPTGTSGTATINGSDQFTPANQGLRFRPSTALEERFTVGSVVYTSSTTWTAPAGVTAVDVEVWGGGGAGGGNTQASDDGGGGGGGGAYSKKLNISVTPGNGYTVNVGAGGTAAAASNGGVGGDSYFIDASTVMAKGGGGGGRSTGAAGTSGTGGAAASGVGDTKNSGGNGGAGNNSTTGVGGGGGGGAGTAASGNNGTAASVTGATAVVGGGPGGYGFTVAGNGLTPDIGPGGGGGGGGEGTTAKGGDGKAGRVRITYYYGWVAPTGVTSVDVEVWGGGGGGGGQQRIISDGGGGGGGGAYSKKMSVSVTPGNTYTIAAGGGGLGGTCVTGVAGSDSYFIDTSTVLAKGGAGGANSTGTPPSGGTGGASASGVGDVKFSGGNGGKGRDSTDGRGAPGGSSAGTASNGVSGATTWVIDWAARPPLGGGKGADGGNADGVNGFAVAAADGNGGGGGGAAESPSTTTCTIGGAGTDGKVILTYTPASGATVDTYTTGSIVYTASTTWTAPTGVTAVNVEVWGGGGAGGGNNDATADGGGGGGGGAYAKKSNISVTPGNGYTVNVGAGGTAVASSAGGAGGDSYFIDASTVMAKGGSGGNPNVGTAGSGTGGSGGAGGTTGASVGDTKAAGGAGRAGTNSTSGTGGGGGSSGGTAGTGTTAGTAPTGAVAVIGGGPGGYGTAASGTTDGIAPDIGPGGGGGGAAEGAAVKGGNGFVGRVRITYIYTWTAPTGVTSVDVEVWGAGGGGGGQQRIVSDGGGGGGGGAYSRISSVAVTPGNNYSLVAGAGGLGGTCLAGLAGEDSYFVDVSTVMAKGGGGGENSTGSPPAGPAGGAVGSGVTEASYGASGGAGGTGRDSTTGLGGAGGSSAGTSAIGTSGASTWATATAAAAPTGGGIGGNGAGTIGTNGSAPASGNGGGGGGAGESPSTTTCSIGGAGADGKVALTYTAGSNSAPTITVSQPDGTSDTVFAGDSYNITYDLADSDDTVTAAFYYDSDSSGLDGTTITGACATAAEGTGVTCAWNTTGVSPGTYYVYGIVDDGVNSPVSDYSSGQITINATTISITVGDGTVAYGLLAVNTSRSTSTGMWDTQTATNTGNVPEDFNIQGTNSGDWTLASSPGSEQYTHAFCTASCTSPPTNYTALATSNSTLVSNIGVGSAQAFDLNLTTPTATTHYTQQTVNVTVTAVQH